jgi:hypothetical protein
MFLLTYCQYYIYILYVCISVKNPYTFDLSNMSNYVFPRTKMGFEKAENTYLMSYCYLCDFLLCQEPPKHTRRPNTLLL